MDDQPTISTHVLDTQHGEPASGVDVALYRMDTTAESRVGAGFTDGDGRIRRLLEGELVAGTYRIDFHVDRRFFLDVSLTFVVDDPTRSYHVPLLLAPYSIASYRGS
jgi:5-hydroxyisourate hydrolase